MPILDNIRVSIEEKNKIKKDSPDSLPLNATAQGYSGQEVRRRLSKSLVGEEGSLLRLVIDKMEILSSLLHSILDESDENSIIEQLNKKLSLDGSLAMNGELDLGLNKIIQVLKGTSIKDAANMQNIEDQLPRDGSRPMLSDLDLNGNEIKRVHDIEFHNGGVIGNFLGNAIHITIPTGETLIFYEEGLDLFSRKLLRVAKGVGSLDGANMQNIAEVLLDSKTYADGKMVDKLDKNFDILTEQSILNLTDSIVINRGNVPYKTSLTNLLARMGGGDLFIVVATLPETGLPNKIYLVPKSENDIFVGIIQKQESENDINSVPQIEDEDEDENDNNNELDEYVWIENGWERIGGVSVDLSNYYDKDQVDVLLVNKLDKNADIIGATKTKITYDSKGLVTAGADLETEDIPALPASKITQGSTARFVTDTEKSTWNGKQNALTAGDGISISGDVISATNEGYPPDEETITLNEDDKLEVTNVAIWRYE